MLKYLSRFEARIRICLIKNLIVMKKVNLFFTLLTFAAASFITSCGTSDEEATPPTLNVTRVTAAGSIPVGSSVEYTIMASSNEEMKTLDIVTTTTGATGTGITAVAPADAFDGDEATYTGGAISYKKNISTSTITYKYIVPTGATSITITIKATDKDDEISEKTETITVGTPTADVIDTYSAILLGSASYNNTTGSFFSTKGGLVGNESVAAGEQGKYDFGYFYGATKKATLASIDDSNWSAFNVHTTTDWTTKNQTRFTATSLSTTDFDGYTTSAQLETAVPAGGASFIDQLQSGGANYGKIIAFTTQDGREGLIKIGAITNGSNPAQLEGSGTISITVKIQKSVVAK